MAAEGPVASGSVTPGTVEEAVLVQLLDMPNCNVFTPITGQCLPGQGATPVIVSPTVRFSIPSPLPWCVGVRVRVMARFLPIRSAIDVQLRFGSVRR